MQHFSGRILVLLAFLGISLAPCFAEAQNAGPRDDEVQDMARSFGMDPARCDGLQAQIDKVVNIYRSAATEDEKVSQLTDALAESLSNMRESGQKDPEVDRLVKQYLIILEGLLSSVRDSFKAGVKQLPPDAKNELQKLRILTGTYMGMMKMMCPKLNLPDVMNK